MNPDLRAVTSIDQNKELTAEPNVKQSLSAPMSIEAEFIEIFSEDGDLQALAEAVTAAVLDGGGFGWVNPPAATSVEQYYRGVTLVPEQELIIGRMDGIIYGAAQLQKPSRNNEAQAFAIQLMHHFVAPYARGHGLGRLILRKAEERARSLGFRHINLDVRATQIEACGLYKSEGFIQWGTHPAYARIKGQLVAGHFFYKALK